MIECRPATLEDLDEPPLYRVRAWVALKDGQKIGIGGNVSGVYILLQLEITAESIARQHKAIEAYFQTIHRG